MFALVYTNGGNNTKRFNAKKNIIYQKELLIIILSSSMEKTFAISQLIQI